MRQALLAAAAAVILLGGVEMPEPLSAQSADGHPAFFWFDSRKISDAGDSSYGAYAYRRLLPALSPQRRPGSADHFAFFDGDFLPQGRLDIPHQAGQEAIAQGA